MEKEKNEKTQPITYYGKKAYLLNPLIARSKPTEKKIPNYNDQNSDDWKGDLS